MRAAFPLHRWGDRLGRICSYASVGLVGSVGLHTDCRFLLQPINPSGDLGVTNSVSFLSTRLTPRKKSDA